MIKNIKYLYLFILVCGCAPKTEIAKYGQHYQKFNDYKSLAEAVKLMPTDISTSEVKKILGDPIDNGFDYRYLVDSTGVNNCPVGAVFNIDQKGKITNRWIDEICE
ncbi:hypothetical protein SAMN05443549_10672 [Flavobacterium fluvii]|uniref:SmpA / OmlA family protein n=1 Tax=Flavobacterium fluvii TaxID=468056 RepID=A0A1M5M876_9FLAO|nr:hypothetical protein [Flavobacterium fluvii]SHG73428.1 hypothetical protein SAMN05443549_10672 [Flavobacterium fluvii]